MNKKECFRRSNMNTIFKLLLLFLIFECMFFHNSNAQTRVISGTIYDYTSKKVVSGIEVGINGVEEKTATNSSGHYSLFVPDTMKTISFSDFKDNLIMGIKNISDSEIDIYLSHEDLFFLPLKDLLNIQFETAGKQEQVIKDIPASVIVITREEIDRIGYKNLNEIIENIQGFYSLGNAYFEGGTNFGVRGFSSGGALSDFMIMINGISQIEDFSNSFSTDKILVPVEAIERIEVVRGPNAVIHGSSAFMGAINIITTDKNALNNSVISTSIGSNNSQKATLHLAKSTNDISFVVNASISKSEGLNVKYADMQSDSSIIKSWGLKPNASTKGQLGGIQNYFEIWLKYKKFSFSILNQNNQLGTMGSKPSANTDVGYKLQTNNTNFSAFYKNEFRNKIYLNSRMSYYNYTQNGNPHFSYANSYNLFDTKVSGYEAEVSGIYKPNEKFDIVIGLNNHTVLDAVRTIDFSTSPEAFHNFKYFLNENQNIAVNSVFSQINFKPIPKLLLVAGARLEKVNSFDIKANHDYLLGNKDTTIVIDIGTINYHQLQFIPRLAAIYHFNDNNVLKFMYGKSKKRPSILEDVNIASRSLYGLKFAEMQTFEIIFSREFKKSKSIEFSLFYNILDNLVLRQVNVSPTGIVTTRAENAGKMNTYGVSICTKLNLVKNIELKYNLIYQQSHNKTNGYPEEVSYSPNFLSYLALIYTFKKVEMTIYSNYVAQMRPGWNINTDPTKSNWYGEIVPSYTKLNYNIRVNNIWKSMYLAFNVSNILNTKIHYPTTQNSTWSDKGMLGFGRFYQLTIGYKF